MASAPRAKARSFQTRSSIAGLGLTADRDPRSLSSVIVSLDLLVARSNSLSLHDQLSMEISSRTTEEALVCPRLVLRLFAIMSSAEIAPMGSGWAMIQTQILSKTSLRRMQVTASAGWCLRVPGGHGLLTTPSPETAEPLFGRRVMTVAL